MNIEIIAELAQGFEGNLQQAKLLVKAAAKAGANAGKLQLVYADELATPDYEYYPLFKELEMTDQEWLELANYAKSNNIELQVDIFGEKSLELAENIGVTTVKVHGTDINNANLLNRISQSRIPRILLGVGGALSSEVEKAVSLIANKSIIFLLGFQGYPTAVNANQIARVALFAERYKDQTSKHVIGFADHASPDSLQRVSLAALALGAGARVIEKHLTLGQVMELEDFEAALNPDLFAEFVAAMRECCSAYGSSISNDDFGMSDQEAKYRLAVRRHVVAGKPLKAGTKLEPGDLQLKRTSAKGALTDVSQSYGKTLTRDIDANQAILEGDVK